MKNTHIYICQAFVRFRVPISVDHYFMITETIMPQRFATILPILLYFFLVATSESGAQTLDWIRLESDERQRIALGVSTDSSGNAIMAGHTNWSTDAVPAARIRDAFVSKYDSTGSPLWSVNWRGDSCCTMANGVGNDRAGNVYVVGETRPVPSNTDMFLAKYDSEGKLLWDVTLDDETERFSDVVVGPTGSVFALGQTLGTLGDEKFGDSYDGVIARFDPDGNREWIVQYEGGIRQRAVSADAEGNLIVTEDHRVLKFDDTGEEVWQYELGDGFTYRDSTVDDAGNVVSLGVNSFGDIVEDSILLTKLDAMGSLLWNREFRVDERHNVRGVEITNDGSLFIAGYSTKVSEDVENSAFLSRLDREGNLIWTAHLDYPGDQTFTGISIGGDNSVYLAGRIRCELDGPECPNTGYGNAFLARFNVNDEFIQGDYNFDGELSLLDIDLYSQEIQQESLNSFYDLNQDRAVTSEDLALWISDNKGTFVGDTNLDSKVDFDDFLALSGGFGGEGSWSNGDLDASGAVDFADFLLLSQNFGNAAAIPAANVPAPSSAASGMIAAMCLALIRRRNCHSPGYPGASA